MKRVSCAPPLLCRYGMVAVAMGEQARKSGNQLSAILDGILVRVETPNEERRHSEVVVIQQSVGDLIGRSHQSGGVSLCTGFYRDRGIETFIQPFTLGG